KDSRSLSWNMLAPAGGTPSVCEDCHSSSWATAFTEHAKTVGKTATKPAKLRATAKLSLRRLIMRLPHQIRFLIRQIGEVAAAPRSRSRAGTIGAILVVGPDPVKAPPAEGTYSIPGRPCGGSELAAI